MVDIIPGTILIIILAQWILEYRQDSGNAAFPFGRPLIDLYKRCQTAFNILSVFQTLNHSVNAQVQKLQKTIRPFFQSATVTQTLKILCDRIVLFDNLRDVFKLESDVPEEILHLGADGGKFEEFEAYMKKNVEAFLSSLKKKHYSLPHDNDMKKAVKIVIDHLDNHWKYLWGHPIRLQVGCKTFCRVIGRTNNLLETFFHELKHRERRRSGRKNLGNDFESIPASIAVTANLLDNDYVKIICGSLNSLPLLFSQIDQVNKFNAYSQEAPSIYGSSNEIDVRELHKIPNNKTFVRKSTFTDWIKNILLRFDIVEPGYDTISTEKPAVPFAVIDDFLSQFEQA